MKQNTKFLWMYILILFSFALILIVFAGLSKNTEDEQERGLRQDITELSHKNTELSAKITELENQINILTIENTNVKTENDALKKIEEAEDAMDALLMQALNAKNAGDKETFNSSFGYIIDPTQLTELQKQVYSQLEEYNKIINPPKAE